MRCNASMRALSERFSRVATTSHAATTRPFNGFALALPSHWRADGPGNFACGQDVDPPRTCHERAIQLMEAEMALRDEIERIQEVLKINERSMRSPDRELFHSILGALRDIEEASRPKVRQVVNKAHVPERPSAPDRA